MHHGESRGPEVVVYHPAYGLRPAIVDFADKLRAAGHVVHTPDLYDGEVFSDRNDRARFADPAFPAYDADAAELMTQRVMEFLDGVRDRCR